MKIMMLSWEYPPKSVGGLAQHVYDLTTNLARSGQEIDLITAGDHQLPSFERVNGINVHRVTPYDVSPSHFIPWILQLNISMLEKAVSLFNKEGYYHIIHVHDWLVAYAGRALKHINKIPMIATIHATEYGRNQGLHNQDQRYIGDVEWWLAFEAWQVICCSSYMQKELETVYKIPRDKIKIIYNGVSLENYQTEKSPEAVRSFRNQFAEPQGKIVFFVGRLVQEKGVQVLLEAVPEITTYYPKTKFVISGKGPMMEELKNKAVTLGIEDKVIFTGYIDDETRNLLYASSDVAVFPSLYEPFGIVALEGMATETPVVVSDTGGLSEIIDHGRDGFKTPPGSADYLARDILKILTDENTARKLSQRAYQKVKELYSWEGIASKTMEVYQEVFDAYRQDPWSREALEIHENKLQSVNRYFTRENDNFNLARQERGPN